ncbi:MAG: UDP-N-acetylmuramate--alanine ligase, partial [Sphingobacteriales bacterium]|nr:UDP-N-acetylmuramate--alanine ligase [Sphingobacteriales bacterium]
IVQYEPEVGVLLNIDKDHQEIDELLSIFDIFKKNTNQLFVVNQSNVLAKTLSASSKNDFSVDASLKTGFTATDFNQYGLTIAFKINGVDFKLNTVGKHNMENAWAATAVAKQVGVGLEICAAALEKYEGIHRRHQVLGNKNGVWVIDDYAHNPAKCAASIAACQYIAPKVIAWFQPHGYGPTRFLRSDFVKEIAAVLRPEDEIWMSEIFYAGGTAVKDISANDLITDIKALGKSAFFVENRNELLNTIRPHFSGDTVLLLMGARDPALEQFGKDVWEKL